MEHRLAHAQARDHPGRLLGQHGAAARAGRDEQRGSHVSVPDVLRQGCVDQFDHVAREPTSARYFADPMWGERGRLAVVGACAAIAFALMPAGAEAFATPATYQVGIANRTINPTAQEIASGKVYLGGFGFGSPPTQSGRPATGILGDGASVRAFVVSDGQHPFAIADMEVQGWFAATKDGPYGIVDMRHQVEQDTNGALKAEEVFVQSD